MNDFELRGVTWSLLSALGKIARLRDCSGLWSIARVVNELIGTHELLLENCRWKGADGSVIAKDSTLTGATKLSLIDHLKSEHSAEAHPELELTYEQAVGSKANVFVSFAYLSDFFEMLSCLDSFFAENPQFLKESTYFWFDGCVNNQWIASEKSFDWWANTFRNAVSGIGHTLAVFTPWNAPDYLTRAWCLFELSCGEHVSVQFSSDQQRRLFDALLEDFPSIERALCTVDLRRSDCWLQQDKDRIFEVVEQLPGGFDALNRNIASKMRNWLLRSLKVQTVTPFGEDPDQAEQGPMYDRLLLADVTATVSTIYPHSHTGDKRDGDSVLVARLTNLAILQSTLGQLDVAEMLLRKLVLHQERLNRSKTSTTMMMKKNLASVLSKTGRLSDSQTMHEDVLEGYKLLYGPGGIDTLHQMANLAYCLTDQGKLNEGQNLYEQALHGLEAASSASTAVGGAAEEKISSVDLYFVLNQLARLYMKKEMFESAESMAIRALELPSRKDRSSINTLTIIQTLADIYLHTKRLQESRQLFEEVLRGKEKTLGVSHPSTMSCLFEYSGLLRAIGDLEGARFALERVHSVASTILGPTYSFTLVVLSRLAWLAFEQGCPNRARVLFQQVVDGSAISNGATHLTTLEARINVAIASTSLCNMLSLESGNLLLSTALVDCVNALGENHSLTQQCKGLVETGRININSIHAASAAPISVVVQSTIHSHPLTKRELLPVPREPSTKQPADDSTDETNTVEWCLGFSCDICGKELLWWAYSCGNCNFDAHILCALNPTSEPPIKRKFCG